MKILAIILSLLSVDSFASSIDSENFTYFTEAQRTHIGKILTDAIETLKILPQDENALDMAAKLKKMALKIQATEFELEKSDNGMCQPSGGAEVLAYVAPNFFSKDPEDITINTIHICPSLLAMEHPKIFQVLLHETAHVAGIGLEQEAVYFEVLVQLLADIPPYTNPVYLEFGRRQRPSMIAWHKKIKAALGHKKISSAFSVRRRMLPNFKDFYEKSIAREVVDRDNAADCQIFSYDGQPKTWDDRWVGAEWDVSIQELLRDSEGDSAAFKVRSGNEDFYIACTCNNGLYLYENDVTRFLSKYFN